MYKGYYKLYMNIVVNWTDNFVLFLALPSAGVYKQRCVMSSLRLKHGFNVNAPKCTNSYSHWTFHNIWS